MTKLSREDKVNLCLFNLFRKDPLAFTRHLFKATSNRRFVVGNHHAIIADKLSQILNGTHPTNKLIINIAPRYGKTLLVSQMFIALGMAVNPKSNFLHLSYSKSLATQNSVAVKDIIESDEYQRLFPWTAIKAGEDTKAEWATTAGGCMYATSTLGQITGFGAGVVQDEGGQYEFSGAIVIDDPIKPVEALSDNVREQVNQRFENTIRSRTNNRNTPIIIIMQRLHEHDLCGYLMEKEPDLWDVVSLPCLMVDDNGEEHSLWPFKHTVEELHRLRGADSFVYETQYQQNPRPMEGLMYESFRTYDIMPLEDNRKKFYKNYTDTADTGSDFLCSISYVEYPTAMYVTDVIYTKKPMEYTENVTAEMLVRNDTALALIEGNNGGRGFARNVEHNVRLLGNMKMRFVTFTQSKNKNVRIYTRSAEVQNLVYFPSGWERRWPEFAHDIKAFRREGHNAHDDGPDVLSGMCEHFGESVQIMSDEEVLDALL